MFDSKKSVVLLVTGIAAYAYYKYKQLTPEAKQQFASDLKETGTRVFEKIAPIIQKELAKR